MANFSSTGPQCEDPNCTSRESSDDIASYGVQETRYFCSNCAEKNQGVIRPRSNPRQTTFCAEHRERRAKWFCTSHSAAVCQDCGSSPNHETCTLTDVEYGSDETTVLLQNALAKVGLKEEEFIKLGARRQAVSSDVDKHFKDIEGAINEAQKENEQRRRGRTNPISRGPGRDHRMNTDADKKEQQWNDQDAKGCLAQITEGHRRANVLVMIVKGQCERGFAEARAATQRIEQLLREDVRDMKAIKSSIVDIDDKLKFSVDEHLLQVVKDFIKGIKYVRSDTCCIGRVEGCRRSFWYLSNTIVLPPNLVEDPRVRCIDSTEVAVLDVKNKVVFSVNLQNMDLRRLEDKRPIDDLILWQDGKIVCIDDDRLSLSVYSRQWQVRHVIPQPGLVFENLAVGSNGNLLVLTDNGQRIYTIKPTDIRIRPKTYISNNLDSIKDIVALPSGHIIVKQHKSTFTILSEKGKQVRMVNEDNWGEADIAVDRTTGTPYVMYFNRKRKDFALCRVSVAGAVVEEEVFGMCDLLDQQLPIHIDVFGSNKLYIINGHRLFVFTLMRPDDT